MAVLHAISLVHASSALYKPFAVTHDVYALKASEMDISMSNGVLFDSLPVPWRPTHPAVIDESVSRQ